MKVIVNLLGVEVRLKQEVFVEPASVALRDVVKALQDRGVEQLEHFVDDRLAPVGGTVILVNGRNYLSVGGWDMRIGEGDELTFMVPVAGG